MTASIRSDGANSEGFSQEPIWLHLARQGSTLALSFDPTFKVDPPNLLPPGYTYSRNPLVLLNSTIIVSVAFLFSFCPFFALEAWLLPGPCLTFPTAFTTFSPE